MNAKEFRNIREELGISRPELSDKLGKSVGMIERYEKGTSPINKTVSFCMKSFQVNFIKKRFRSDKK